MQLDSVISDLMGATGQRILRCDCRWGARPAGVGGDARQAHQVEFVDPRGEPRRGHGARSICLRSSRPWSATISSTRRSVHCEAAMPVLSFKALSPPEDSTIDVWYTGGSAPPQGKPDEGEPHAAHLDCCRMMGVDLTAIPISSVPSDRTGDCLRDWSQPVGVSDHAAFLFLARFGAGHAHQR